MAGIVLPLIVAEAAGLAALALGGGAVAMTLAMLAVVGAFTPFLGGGFALAGGSGMLALGCLVASVMAWARRDDPIRTWAAAVLWVVTASVAMQSTLTFGGLQAWGVAASYLTGCLAGWWRVRRGEMPRWAAAGLVASALLWGAVAGLGSVPGGRAGAWAAAALALVVVRLVHLSLFARRLSW